MQSRHAIFNAVLAISLAAESSAGFGASDVAACIEMAKSGLRPIAEVRSERFLGKVEASTAQCRGGDKAVGQRRTPWVDWANYWATGDAGTLKAGEEAKTVLGTHLKPNGRGIDGSLLDLEYQRIELIKFNLFDNYTYETYVKGPGDRPGSAVNQWDEMRLTADHPDYASVGGSGPQLCSGELIRYRTLTGICNDIRNPKMGSSGAYFSRNVDFESTFPRLGNNELARARHGDQENGSRIDLYKPDPQLISRVLFTRQQKSDTCNEGYGAVDYATTAHCDYLKAPVFNVLAAFWIQFMTHDWFSHLHEGRNKSGLITVGCESEQARALGCRSQDRAEGSLFELENEPGTFDHNGVDYLRRAPKTTANTVTAWWDASQIYGYDAASLKRAIRDPNDPAKLLQPKGYLPLLDECVPECRVEPQWHGQEAAAFPDNWNIGMSFYHNLFVREHNSFVDRFREQQLRSPKADSGMRHPDAPARVIAYADASDEEIYQAARLVVSALIAKIHTIEWTPQLLYGEPLYRVMNANWFGLFNLEENDVSLVLKKIFDKEQNIFSRTSSRIARTLGMQSRGDESNSWYSVLASGAGIFGLNNSRVSGQLWWKQDRWDLANPDDVNGGVNHFGSPFNFPEEFTSVYRLHALVPDLIEYRDLQRPNAIALKIPVVKTVRGEASREVRARGLGNWALSMGRQRLGLLHLRNHPMFLQNLEMGHLGPGNKLDIVALDIFRDRERGIPRYNEFRRQIGLKSLSSFDDFIDQRLPMDSPQRRAQEEVVSKLREIYGAHICDEGKIITNVQYGEDGKFINDCLGHADKSVVDNVEDVDTLVGWLAEYTRPHGFAISETQFHVFIINASRRLFSDRFFTSSFRPEFYSHLGYNWVLNNGPLDDCPYPVQIGKDGKQQCNEPEPSNGHVISVSPLKRVLMRNVPELRDELIHVVNTFDPWARDRGEYYSLAWRPRDDAADDPAFEM